MDKSPCSRHIYTLMAPSVQVLFTRVERHKHKHKNKKPNNNILSQFFKQSYLGRGSRQSVGLQICL